MADLQPNLPQSGQTGHAGGFGGWRRHAEVKASLILSASVLLRANVASGWCNLALKVQSGGFSGT